MLLSKPGTATAGMNAGSASTWEEKQSENFQTRKFKREWAPEKAGNLKSKKRDEKEEEKDKPDPRKVVRPPTWRHLLNLPKHARWNPENDANFVHF